MNLQDIRSSQDWVEFALTHKSNTMPQVASNPDLEQAMKNAISQLPRFNSDGNDSAIIIYVGAEPSRFQADELALCIYLWNPARQQGDWWRGGLSSNFIQIGNHFGKTYMQNTIEILQKIGYDTYKAGGFSGLAQLVGVEIPIWIKRVDKDGKTYFNVGSIGSSLEVPASVSLGSINLNAGGAPPVFGQPQSQPQPQPQPQPQQQQQTAFQQPAQPQYQQPPVFGQPQQQAWQQPQQPQPQQPQPQQPQAAGSPYSSFGGGSQQQGGLI